MGLDGGTIITRSDVIRGQSWKASSNDTSRSTRGGSVSTAHASRAAQQEAATRQLRRMRWSVCALSGRTLQPPIVADRIGMLYNKDAVLELLLGRTGAFPDDDARYRYENMVRSVGVDTVSHIRSRRDVFEVKLSCCDEKDSTAAADGGTDDSVPHMCPVTHVSCLRHPMSAIATCGHILSDRAIAQISEAGACAVCGARFNPPDDVIPINGTAEQIATLREQLQRSVGPKRNKRAKVHGILEGGVKKRKHDVKLLAPAS